MTVLEGCALTGADVVLAESVQQADLEEVASWPGDLLTEVRAFARSVSQRLYYHWSDRNDSLVAPYNACSPNLTQLFNFGRTQLGGVSLGCHNQRTVSGSSTLSSHAWGAAFDVRFPTRAITVETMDALIAYSVELGVNTIHDYVTQQMWKPNVGWRSASIGSVGGTWIHVETTPEAFSDSRPVLSRFPDEPGAELTAIEIDMIAARIATQIWS